MPYSPTRVDAPSPFQSALLLTDDEANASADRTTLRGAGIRQVRIQTSGVEAARYLAGQVSKVLFPVTEIVVCLPQMADMNASEFAVLIRTHPLLVHIPLLAVTAERGQNPLLCDHGFNGVLQRPFTTNALVNELQIAADLARTSRAALIENLKRDNAIPSHKDFDDLLAQYIPPDRESMTGKECCQYGISLLQACRGQEALPYLLRAALETESKGEACMAMATLWLAQNEPAKMKSCLLGALQGFIDMQAWPQVRSLTKRMTTDYPNAPSPLLRELERHTRQGHGQALLDMLNHVRDLLTDKDTRQALLIGCRNSPAPDQALTDLLQALRDERNENCSVLADRLENDAGRKPMEAATRRRWFRRGDTKNSAPFIGIALAPDNSLQNKKKEIGIALADLPPYQNISLTETTGGTPAVNGKKSSADPREGAWPPENNERIRPGKHSPLSDRIAQTRAEQTVPPDGSGFGKLDHKGPVLPLLDHEEEDSTALRSSPLKDAWTVIRGTMRLYRASKKF